VSASTGKGNGKKKEVLGLGRGVIKVEARSHRGGECGEKTPDYLVGSNSELGKACTLTGVRICVERREVLGVTVGKKVTRIRPGTNSI